MTYSAEVLADSPRWYLRLGEASGTTASDSSGNSHPGTYTGVGTITYNRTGLLYGDANTAVRFIASGSGNVHVPDTQIYTSCTMEAWVVPSDTTARTFLVQSNGSPSGSFSLTLYTTSAGKFAAHVYDQGASTGKDVVAPTSFTTGATYHVAATITNGGSFLLYVNGALVATTTGIVTCWNSNNDWFVGSYSGIAGAYWDSDVDEVAVYTSVLSGARILAHYDAGIPSPATPISGTDTPTISATDTSAVVVIVAKSATDTPTVSLSESATAQTATPISGTDTPTISVTATVTAQALASNRTDTLTLSVTESNLIVGDPYIVVATDTLTVGIGERTSSPDYAPGGVATRFTSSYLPVG